MRTRPTLTERSRAWDLAFVAAAGLALLVLIYLGRSLTFFNDEWSFIDTRLGWNLDAFMAPHNEHWVLGVALLWKPLLAIAGLHSYLPYLGLELIAHLITAAALYWWLRRQAGGMLAFTATLVFLFLGTGAEVFFQGIAVNLVGATAAGAWALVLFLADPIPRRTWPVALLLLVSIAFGGDGLCFVAAVAAVICVSRGRLRQAWVLVPAAAGYGVWLLTYGRGTLAAAGSGALDDPQLLLQYAQVGLAHAVGSLTGVGPGIGLVLGVAVVGATIAHLFGQGAIREGAVAGVAGLVTQLVITGLVRGQAGAEQAEAPRYVYISAVFLLIITAAWLKERPTLGVTRRVVFPLLVLVGVALAANLHALFGSAAIFSANADQTRAAITVLTRYGGSPAIPADAKATDPSGYLSSIPGPARLRVLLDAYGSPLHDALLPGAATVPADVLDRVLLEFAGGSLYIDPVASMPATATGRTLSNASDVTAEAAGSCQLLHPTGPTPRIDLMLPVGWSMYAQVDIAGTAHLSLSVSGPFGSQPARNVTLAPGIATRIALPDLGGDAVWKVRFDLVPTGNTLVCFSPPDAAAAIAR